MLKIISHQLALLSFSMISGILLYLSWPDQSLNFLLFFAIIPILFSIDYISQSDSKLKFLKIFAVVFLAIYIWQSFSLGWLKAASPRSYQIAITIGAFDLAMIFIPTFFIRKKLGENWQWVYTICSWVALEYLNQYWLMGTPYFILGNGFGKSPAWIQSYEYIGIEGGSFFILLTNLAIYLCIKAIIKKSNYKTPLSLLFIGILPFILSKFISHDGDGKKIKVAAVHTFTENRITNSDSTIEETFQIMRSKNLNNVSMVLWPETIISNLGWTTNFVGDKAYQAIEKNIKYSSYSLCLGGYAFSPVKDIEGNPYVALDKARNMYYQAHNIAFCTNSTGQIQYRAKALFIPFQERIPLLNYFQFLKSWADIIGSNTMISPIETDKNLLRTNTGEMFLPVLCYESTFPLQMAIWATDAEFIALLANENWNKDLRGSEQYLCNNVGIAIQSRTAIVRSSNSGISAIIDANGKVIERRKGRNIGVIKQEIQLKTSPTFYESIAGFFYNVSSLISIGILLLSFVKRNK